MVADIWAERRVAAHNSSRESENRIHADDVARRYGFRGGLVPGVTVYGYLAGMLTDTLGEAWVGGGRTAVRFRSPCYEGDGLEMRLYRDGALEVAVAGATCVTGRVESAEPAPAPGDGGAAHIPAASRPDPSERPLVSSSLLAAGTVLGSVPLETTADAVAAYTRKVDGAPAVLAERGWVHPGMLLEAANLVLMANVVMPLWLHVGSEITHLRPLTVGEAVEVRARVAREWEQKGHRFVTLDVGWVSLEQPGMPLAATATHTAIWQLAGT